MPEAPATIPSEVTDQEVILTPGALCLGEWQGDSWRLSDMETQGAHTLFCEASFTQAHGEQARRTSHLTARACGEIAVAAAAERLVPFHFSRRYETDPGQVYREVLAACPRSMVPQRETGF